MSQTTATRTRYVDSAEVAKMIRKELKKAFAGIAFSVRTRRRR